MTFLIVILYIITSVISFALIIPANMFAFSLLDYFDYDTAIYVSLGITALEGVAYFIVKAIYKRFSIQE